MTIARYCKLKGMSFDEFEKFESMVENKADAIINAIGCPKNDGMYFKTDTILNESDADIRRFVINALRLRGMEFIEDCEYYRY